MYRLSTHRGTTQWPNSPSPLPCFTCSCLSPTRTGTATPSSRTSRIAPDGDVRLSTGTLYGIIKRLLADGWIAEARTRRAADDDERRRYYRLTPLDATPPWPKPRGSSAPRRRPAPRCGRAGRRPPEGAASCDLRTAVRAQRAYRALLRLLPGDFRAEFGHEMEGVFLDEHREASGAARRGASWRLWLRTLGGILADRAGPARRRAEAGPDVLRPVAGAHAGLCRHRRARPRARHRRDVRGADAGRIRSCFASCPCRNRSAWSTSIRRRSPIRSCGRCNGRCRRCTACSAGRSSAFTSRSAPAPSRST